jgi:hypothetical protein
MLGNSANDMTEAGGSDIKSNAACVPGIFAQCQPMPRWLR